MRLMPCALEIRPVISALALRVGRRILIRTLIPSDPQPPETLHEAHEAFLGVPNFVGVLDTEDKAPAIASGEKVIEKRGPSASDMKLTCRGGRETNPRWR
jgi:hypothetical protein